MQVSNLSTMFVQKMFHSKKNWARYDQKCILVSVWNTRYSCPILMKIELFQQIFQIFSNTKFRENPSSESRVVPCGRGRQTWS